MFSVAILRVAGPQGRSLLVTGNMHLNGIVGWTYDLFPFPSQLQALSQVPYMMMGCHYKRPQNNVADWS